MPPSLRIPSRQGRAPQAVWAASPLTEAGAGAAGKAPAAAAGRDAALPGAEMSKRRGPAPKHCAARHAATPRRRPAAPRQQCPLPRRCPAPRRCLSRPPARRRLPTPFGSCRCGFPPAAAALDRQSSAAHARRLPPPPPRSGGRGGAGRGRQRGRGGQGRAGPSLPPPPAGGHVGAPAAQGASWRRAGASLQARPVGVGLVGRLGSL